MQNYLENKDKTQTILMGFHFILYFQNTLEFNYACEIS